jgi:hypothetical protein
LEETMKRLFSIVLVMVVSFLIAGLALISAEVFADAVRDASGIARVGEYLLIVGDDDPGCYFRFAISAHEGPEIKINPTGVTRVEWPHASLALDLEAIDVLADGRVVVLSERLRALIGKDGIIAQYDNPLSEFGNRGLEGLAVRTDKDGGSRVAVLWEGGYPEYKDVPRQLQKHVGRLPMSPVVWIHDLKAGETRAEINDKNKERYSLRKIEVNVPKPLGEEPQVQRFRAPDLVWHKLGEYEWGFIFLLSSENSPEHGKPGYMHKWLQRFTVDGAPLGDPIDLNTVIPAHLKGANWEGLGWFEEGKRLVVIHDKPPKGPPTAFIVELPPEWRKRK